MKINLILVLAFLLLQSCQSHNDLQKNTALKNSSTPAELPGRLSSRRVSFGLNLKRAVAQKAWTDFGRRYNEGTLLYFTEDSAEVFFPDAYFTSKLQEDHGFSNDYGLIERTDNFPYHMEVMISFDEADSSQYFYGNPVEQYSSVEEINKYISSVESTEMWSTMVVHEMFHHYQYNNEHFKKYAETTIGVLPFNILDLIGMCEEDEDFFAMIQKENEYLMKALSEDQKASQDSLIYMFLAQRKNRVLKYGKEYPDLEQVENYYIIQEGSARYIEYKSMQVLSEYANRQEAPVILNDSLFKSYTEFEEIDLNSPVFNYLTYAAPSDYHYALGFNMMRLLDVLDQEYKSTLLNNPSKGLHQYLVDYLNSKSN